MMAQIELEKRYKRWCVDAANGKISSEMANGQSITVGPLFRNVPTTPLVLRTDQGSVLAMPSLPSIVQETAQKIDKNAASVAAGIQWPSGEEMLVLTLQELAAALANLGAFSSDNKGLHGLGLHLLPLTVGNWVSEIRLPEGMQALVSTTDRLASALEKILGTGRFCNVAVHKSYVGLSQTDTSRSSIAQKLLQFRDSGAPLMNVLGDDLDLLDLKTLRDPNVLGVYMCRNSMVKRIQENAERALQNFGLFTPEAPLDHVLASRLCEASRVYGTRSRFPIKRFAGGYGPGPVVREIPGIISRAKDIVRGNHGMMQVTTLLVRLVEKMLHVKGRRDGSKERGMLHNLRHATAANECNELVFFLNVTRTSDDDNLETYAPPVLSEFDLQESSSGPSKPSWAKALPELERLTSHDTTEDMRGSRVVTMVGFPFQCTFVLENKPGEPFYYCPHRFANRQDAIEHVKAVHQGEGLTEEIVVQIAQADDQLADTEFGKMMKPINELAMLRRLELDEKNVEMLRQRPTLHADLYKMASAIMQNTRLLERLEKDRTAAVRMLESLDLATVDGKEAAKRQRQMFAARNREITEVKKHMLTPVTLMVLQVRWNRAKSRKAYVTKNMYKEFTHAKDQCLWLDRTLGEEARQYEQKVKAFGGVDPGATPAGVPGGGIRVSESNIGGMIAQDLIEQSRYIEAIQDANQALLATNREACFERVVSKTDVDFRASNVLPAATPVDAADGWEDGIEELDLDSSSSKLDSESVYLSETSRPLEPESSLVLASNPLKRPRTKGGSESEKRGVVALVARDGVVSVNKEVVKAPDKIQVVVPTLQPFLQDTVEVELARIFRVRGLRGVEKSDALEKAKQTLNLAFHNRIQEQVRTMTFKNAMSAGEVRTLMDPLRDKVTILVLTDPRLIRHPNGVLMRKLCTCVALIDAVHKEFPNNGQRLCAVLAFGICTLLQPKFHLSEAGFKLVVEALKEVLLERFDGGRDAHWDVVSKLVEALNANLRGFWNAAFLRRYHDIRDPSHKTRHVDKFPEKTYAPVIQLPTVDAVMARIKRPIVADTSPLSVSPSESSSLFSRLRAEEVATLVKQVSTALSGRDADLVRIVDSEGLEAKAWIDRLVKGNANASDNPHAMCTWFRDKRATTSECMDDEKHQRLRETYCCICSELLGSAPFEGWCCLSGAPSLDAILDNALRDEADPVMHASRRDTMKQTIVNKIISQPYYPSFHFWHRHCKQAEDHRLIVEVQTKAMKGEGSLESLQFDECPLCRTKYPRDEASLPSMAKITHKLERATKFVKRVIANNVLQQSSGSLDDQVSPSTPAPLATQKTLEQPVAPADEKSDDASVQDGSGIENASEERQRLQVARTGVAYFGALFQKDTGCEASPAAMIPPSPAVPPPALHLTMYDEMIMPPDGGDGELEQALESIRPSCDVVDTGTQNPLDISQLNDLMEEIDTLHETATDFGNLATDEDVGSEIDSFLRHLVFETQDNRLLDNIEASALDRELGGDDDFIVHNVVSPSQEMIALDSPEDNFGARVMGGSGSCGRGGCTACPLMMPRTNHIGTRRLSTPVDCQTRDVVYASLCHTCQVLHGIGTAKGSMKEEIRLLGEMSAQRHTLLSRCSLGHVPTIVGLETFTTDEEALAKSAAWEAEFRQMKSMKLQAI